MGLKACSKRSSHEPHAKIDALSCTIVRGPISDRSDDRLCETLSEPFDRAQGKRIRTRNHNPEPFVLSRVEAHFESFHAVRRSRWPLTSAP